MAKQLTKVQIVAIAKDVLKQIKAQKLIAMSGTYFEFDKVSEKDLPDGPFELQKFLKSGKMKSCFVCARGALVLSKARLYDDCKVVFDGDCESDISSYISNTVVRQSGMEGEWENDEAVFGGLGVEAERAFEGGWYGYYGNDEERLIAIMKNIIRNKGIFFSDQPFAKTDPRYKEVTC